MPSERKPSFMMATRNRKPNQLPIKLLNAMTIRVGSGKETAKPREQRREKSEQLSTTTR
jgi:hypothetical protein